jgi:hypothetical protein
MWGQSTWTALKPRVAAPDAAHTADIENKLTLLNMARAWLRLAEQAEKNIETVAVYETPVHEEIRPSAETVQRDARQQSAVGIHSR